MKTCTNASEVAVSAKGDWIATKNSSGQIVVSRASDGTEVHKYDRPPFQEFGQLVPCRDGEHFLDSTEGVVHLHNIGNGRIVRSYSYGNDGWMSQGIAVAKGRFIAGVTPKSANPASKRNVSFLHFFDPEEGSGPVGTIELPGEMERFELSPDESRLATVSGTSERKRLEVQILNLAGEPMASRKLEGGSVFYGSPTWTPDGRSIVVIIDLAHVIFLDAETLQTERELSGPSLTGIALQPGGRLVVLAGDSGFGGVVIPAGQLEEWSEHEGGPRRKRLADQSYAYSLQIDLRKACPPRAAFYRCNQTVVFESERLVGYFRYLPGEVVTRLDLSDRPELLGKALRKTVAAFEDNPAAKEPVPGPAFPGEAERLAEAGVPKDRIDYVRCLGHEFPYAIDHSSVDVMISVVTFEQRLHFWLCRAAEDGRFFETYWPHMHLAASAGDEELGKAILEALDAFPKNTKIVE